MYWTNKLITLNCKGQTTVEIITEAFNEQNDQKLWLAVQLLNHVIYYEIGEKNLNKTMYLYLCSIRDYCIHEYKYIWKRHNQLLNI
jgi:hypothetical protein